MPKEPTPDQKKIIDSITETVSVDDLVQRAKVNTASVPIQTESAGASVPQGSSFKDKGGKWMYRYEISGETIILPKPIEQMSEQDFYDMPISLYENQPGRLPQNLTVKFRDPQWAGYWFNKSAKFGARVSTARALGYVPAKKEDLEWYCLELNDQDGAVEQHDLVLMKIHKAKILMQYKRWIDMAKQQGGINAYKSQAENMIRQGGGDLQKAPYYHTPQATGEFQGVGPVTNIPIVATP